MRFINAFQQVYTSIVVSSEMDRTMMSLKNIKNQNVVHEDMKVSIKSLRINRYNFVAGPWNIFLILIILRQKV